MGSTFKVASICPASSGSIEQRSFFSAAIEFSNSGSIFVFLIPFVVDLNEFYSLFLLEVRVNDSQSGARSLLQKRTAREFPRFEQFCGYKPKAGQLDYSTVVD